MDATQGGSPENILPWQPERRFGGKVEIGVNYFDESIHRMSLTSVSPQHYIELWDANLLEHLYEGTPKPEHLPTREQVIEFLSAEGVKLPDSDYKSVSKPATNVPREAVQATQPMHRPTIVAPRVYKPVPPNLPKPVRSAKPASEFDLDASAAKVFYLTARDREIIRAVLKHERPAGLNESSLKARVSALCTKLGIPSNQFKSFNRRGALEQVWALYKLQSGRR